MPARPPDLRQRAGRICLRLSGTSDGAVLYTPRCDEELGRPYDERGRVTGGSTFASGLLRALGLDYEEQHSVGSSRWGTLGWRAVVWVTPDQLSALRRADNAIRHARAAGVVGWDEVLAVGVAALAEPT